MTGFPRLLRPGGLVRRTLAGAVLILLAHTIAELALPGVRSLRAERPAGAAGPPGAWQSTQERFWTALREMQTSARAIGFR